jgi:hypothetical protein
MDKGVSAQYCVRLWQDVAREIGNREVPVWPAKL